MPMNVLILSAKKEEDISSDLQLHLSVLHRLGKINLKTLSSMEVASNRDDEITRLIDDSKMILVLLSPQMIGLEQNLEVLDKATKRHNSGEIRLIPILARACDLDGVSCSKLVSLPRNGVWLNGVKQHVRDSLLTGIVQELRKLIDSLS